MFTLSNFFFFGCTEKRMNRLISNYHSYFFRSMKAYRQGYIYIVNQQSEYILSYMPASSLSKFRRF